MNAAVINEVRPGLYLDSVALMRFSRAIAALEGVEEAALMMGTPANRQIMANAGLLDARGESATAGDLIVGVRAASAAAAQAALSEAARLLDSRNDAGGDASGEQWRPRTLRAAVKHAPDSNLALISVPGDYAVAEARKAINRGLHVLLFSDNVPVEDETALKREARALGRLVMGPDCGTAIINGVPLAFANKVPKGNVGIIGASGTGIQEVSCLIARGGKGVSQAIGVGGRDLKDAVGGITTLMALDALDRDPDTHHIVIISKPPSAKVAAQVMDRVATSKKPFTICFLGATEARLPPNARLATTLKAAAQSALGTASIGADFDASAVAVKAPRGRHELRGLYSGGTLCAEAQVILKAAGRAVKSNAPIPGVPHLADPGRGHPIVDLGDDEYTRGKPHPMIDPSVRDDVLGKALNDDEVAVVLLDVVIGYGAHADPAGHLADLLRTRATDGPLVVASVTGTDDDPQVRARQVSKLEEMGVIVAPSNADAVAVALACLQS